MNKDKNVSIEIADFLFSSEDLQQVSNCYKELNSHEMSGWVSFRSILDEDGRYINSIKDMAREIKAEYDALVVIGIGGSYLGSRAIYEYLKGKRDYGVELLFAGNNLSYEYHLDIIHRLDKYNPAVCYISKSGETVEPKMAFNAIKEYLKERYPSKWRDRIYTVTDANKGGLRKETVEEGYRTIEFPADIGGRYSVLSAAGLLPLAAAGLDIEQMLIGAGDADSYIRTEKTENNTAFKYAALRNKMWKEGKVLEFFSFINPAMEAFGQWLQQLFAESEGKNGRGIFPSTIVYSRDLHSAEQYLQDGPNVFFETMIEDVVESIDYESYFKEYGDYSKAIADIIHSIRKAKGISFNRIVLNVPNERSVGFLIYFFEVSCALSALLLGVNPFDQPGVEVYKKELLKFEKER